MCLCVILGSGEYTTGFVLVLTVGWLWSGWFSRHACHFFRATRVNFGERDTISVAVHVNWRFPLWSVRLCATKLAFALRRRVESAQHPIGKICCMRAICALCVCGFPFLVYT